MSSFTIAGYNVGRLAKRTLKEIKTDNVFGLSAAGAYNFFFTLFPLLLFLAPLLALVGQKEAVVGGILARLAPLMPPDALSVLERTLREVVFSESAPAMISVGALLAAYTASTAIATISGGLNVAYGVKDKRPWWKQRILFLVLMIVAGIGIAVAAGALIAGDLLLGRMADALNFGESKEAILQWLQYPVMFAMIVGVFFILYYYLPAARLDPRHVLVGSITAALLWIAVTLLFRVYVRNFGSYNKTYGTIGGIILLLTWLYWTVFVLLVGGELNAELKKETEERNR